ncbi:MAG: GPR endopeptidase, partial [Oscillospiraceae bacterium]|nr:GPR endopeptidase [Oscillospiraceae bacterium]
MAQPRTDLALEAALGDAGALPEGVESREEERHGFPVTRVDITTPAGAREVGKPMGRYLTLDLRAYRSAGADAFPRAVAAVGELLEQVIPPGTESALVVGLGNRFVTPDAVGPRAADHV